MTTKQLLIALSNKLQEISDESVDVDTQEKLNEIIFKMQESAFLLK